jgi:hypothetical protein
MRSQTQYMGPGYETLDPALKKALFDYFQELGVNDDLINFIEVMSLDQDAKLYLKWLESTKNFLIE